MKPAENTKQNQTVCASEVDEKKQNQKQNKTQHQTTLKTKK